MEAPTSSSTNGMNIQLKFDDLAEPDNPIWTKCTHEENLMYDAYSRNPSVVVGNVLLKNLENETLGCICVAFHNGGGFFYDGYTFANDVERYTTRFGWAREKLWGPNDDDASLSTMEGINIVGGFLHVFAIHKNSALSVTRGHLLYQFIKSCKFLAETSVVHPWTNLLMKPFGFFLLLDPEFCLDDSMYTPMGEIHQDLKRELAINPSKVKAEIIYID